MAPGRDRGGRSGRRARAKRVGRDHSAQTRGAGFGERGDGCARGGARGARRIVSEGSGASRRGVGEAQTRRRPRVLRALTRRRRLGRRPRGRACCIARVLGRARVVARGRFGEGRRWKPRRRRAPQIGGGSRRRRRGGVAGRRTRRRRVSRRVHRRRGTSPRAAARRRDERRGDDDGNDGRPVDRRRAHERLERPVD